jgi:lysophospholipase L1-like esterase
VKFSVTNANRRTSRPLPARTLLKKLALIPLGVIAALLVLEGGLQVAALALRATGRQLSTEWLSSGRRILCLGDSNTYGLYLRDRSLAYPQQLERLWNEHGNGARIEVLNLGYPGTNSSHLRRDLPRMLESIHPDVVIVMVGANDYWTAAVPLTGPAPLFARIGQFIEQHSRVYQLAYMVHRALENRRIEIVRGPLENGSSSGVIRYGDIEFPVGYTRAAPGPGLDARLLENLGAVAELSRAFGAELIFMTYPSRMWNYGDAGRLIRQAAADSGTRLVDLAAVFDPVCPREPCAEWLYEDHHPTAQGYQLVAETLVRELAGKDGGEP